MSAPLDPVIENIIPLLPLRDPETMTPQSARDALRALAAARAAIPPPQVASADDIKVKGAAGLLAARVYRVSRENAFSGRLRGRFCCCARHFRAHRRVRRR
jgi:acetyl esterase